MAQWRMRHSQTIRNWMTVKMIGKVGESDGMMNRFIEIRHFPGTATSHNFPIR